MAFAPNAHLRVAPCDISLKIDLPAHKNLDVLSKLYTIPQNTITTPIPRSLVDKFEKSEMRLDETTNHNKPEVDQLDASKPGLVVEDLSTYQSDQAVDVSVEINLSQGDSLLHALVSAVNQQIDSTAFDINRARADALILAVRSFDMMVGQQLDEKLAEEVRSAVKSTENPWESCSQAYRSTISKYTIPPSNSTELNEKDDVGEFPAIPFVGIVQNRYAPLLFDLLLELEGYYAQSIDAAWTKHEESLHSLKHRQSTEMNNLVEGVTSVSQNSDETALVSTLSQRHIEEVEVFQATFESELESINVAQKKEFSLLVKHMFEHLQNHRKADANKDHRKSFSATTNASDIPPPLGVHRLRSSSSMSRISEQQPKSSPEEVAWQILSPSISTLSSPSSEVQTLLRRLTASVDEQKRALVPVPTPPPLLPPRDEGSPIVTSSPLIPPASPAEAVDPAREAFAAYIEDMKANEGQKFNMLNELNSMGFTLEHADAALEMTRGNMEQAVSVLLEQPARVTQHSSQKLQNIIARRRQQQQQQQNNPLALLSQTINRSSSTLFKELAGIVREASENVGGGSPQAPVVSPRTSTQSTPTQSPGVTRRPRPPSMFNPLRKVSSILGKALGMEDMNDVDDYPNSPSRRGPSLEDAELSETFMMQFGTQVRTMYNLRMAVLNNGMGDVFRPIIVKAKRDGQEHDGEDAEVADMMARTIAYRAQTASALYSKDLTGAVVLLSSKDFARYGSSRSVNNELIGNCVRSTELHFTDIRKQFEQVRNKLPKDEHGEPILNEGDFFVTRHSNLPLVHVVFHLIYSDESSKELTNRSALLTGYRSVLRLAHHCGVNNLTIPIILLPDDTAFSIDSNANPATVLYRRAELVLKSTKAMITEFSRAVKHGRDSSGVDADAKTFQFVLSQRYSVMMGRPTTQGTADAVVEGFGAVRGALVDVFRAS